KSRPMQRPVQPVARRVAGEHASRPVRAVGRRSQSDDQKLGFGIAEARHRPAPVVPIHIHPPLRPCRLFPVGDQSRTASAGNHVVAHSFQRIHSIPLCYATILSTLTSLPERRPLSNAVTLAKVVSAMLVKASWVKKP